LQEMGRQKHILGLMIFLWVLSNDTSQSTKFILLAATGSASEDSCLCARIGN
jgi:hypothetical protein